MIRKRDIRTLEKRLQRLEQYNRTLEERLHREEKAVDTLCKFAIKPMEHHPDNDHKQYYELFNSNHSTTLTRLVGKCEYYNFVNKTEVLPNQHKKYAVRRINTSALIIGFCTEALIR